MTALVKCDRWSLIGHEMAKKLCMLALLIISEKKANVHGKWNEQNTIHSFNVNISNFEIVLTWRWWIEVLLRECQSEGSLFSLFNAIFFQHFCFFKMAKKLNYWENARVLFYFHAHIKQSIPSDSAEVFEVRRFWTLWLHEVWWFCTTWTHEEVRGIWRWWIHEFW